MGQPFVGQIILVGFNFAPTGWAFCHGQLLAISENETLFNLIGTTFGGDGQSTFAVPDLRSRVPIHQGTGPGASYSLGEASGVETVALVAGQMASHAHPVATNSLAGTLRCRNGAGNQQTPAGGVPAIDPSPPFADPSLVAGSSPVRALHITELRARVNALRAGVGLQPYAWADTTLTVGATVVRAQHLIDLRTALTQACVAGGRSLPVYAEAIAAGTTIRAAHVNELRNALRLTTYTNAAPDATMNAATIQLGGSVTAAATGGNQPHSNVQPYLSLNYVISLFGVYPSPA